MKTWHLEAAVIAAILTANVLVSGGGTTEWIGAAAVFLMTRRLSVGDRMQESETRVECNRWYYRYLYASEACWVVYFVAHEAWSALVGVGIMTLYPVWRKVYRKWKPLK